MGPRSYVCRFWRVRVAASDRYLERDCWLPLRLTRLAAGFFARLARAGHNIYSHTVPPTLPLITIWLYFRFALHRVLRVLLAFSRILPSLGLRGRALAIRCISLFSRIRVVSGLSSIWFLSIRIRHRIACWTLFGLSRRLLTCSPLSLVSYRTGPFRIHSFCSSGALRAGVARAGSA